MRLCADIHAHVRFCPIPRALQWRTAVCRMFTSSNHLSVFRAGLRLCLTSLARDGMSYPARPLPASKPPVDLTQSPVQLAKINLPATELAKASSTLQAAVSGENPSRSIAAGQLRYVSIISVSRVNDKPYVQLKSGEWMRASPAGYPMFQGLQFSRTPSNSFGWMVDHARARSAPGYANPEVGETIYRETPVQIYKVQAADGVDWYQIGPGQWMERGYLRQVRINTQPPEGVTGDRWIEVNLYDQTLSVYDKGQLVFATMVASGGDPFFTRPGLFQIFEKNPWRPCREPLSPTVQISITSKTFHGRCISTRPGRCTGLTGGPGSVMPGHTAVSTFPSVISAWLFDWAQEGDWVYVWDPSGRRRLTPLCIRQAALEANQKKLSSQVNLVRWF